VGQAGGRGVRDDDVVGSLAGVGVEDEHDRGADGPAEKLHGHESGHGGRGDPRERIGEHPPQSDGGVGEGRGAGEPVRRADVGAESTSTVERALRRRGLLLPVGYRADRKSWAAIRRRVFRDPPTQRNRVWQTDFSEFETAASGIWRICAVIDFATKYCLAATITPTARGQDALACLIAAVRHAERLLDLDDLRDDRGEVDLVDETTGELLRTVPAPIAVVSDNGPCFRGAVFAGAFTGDDPLLRHVRTRVKSPQTNGLIERFFGTLKYEHLFRGPIGDGDALTVEVNWFRQIYNTIRPHQALHDRAPRNAYLDDSSVSVALHRPASNGFAETLAVSDAGIPLGTRGDRRARRGLRWRDIS
jgi:putative transposase